MIFFTPPVRLERRGQHPLFGRLRVRQGVSVLKEGDFFRQVSHPTDEELAAADAVYLGGYRYRVTREEADLLAAAGYEAFLEGYSTVSTAYGMGAYGAGPYGGVT